METEVTAYFPVLIIGDQTYDFAHLEPFTFTIASQLAGRDLRVHVTFSSHCFSQGYDQATHPVGEPIILDGAGRPRTFCAIRFRLSLELPTVIQGLNHPRSKVRETAARRNWAYSMTIQDPAGPYHVFFEIRRAAKEKPQDLNLVVESAYHQTEQPPRLLGKMGFILLCGKVYLRQASSTKR
ncbi:hypothetical protein [Pseudomonas fluorescens]|uniref:Uncharacterized protein n=1 Tax=Pseudomonas fluorescens TaxID=294 RepID=A0A5E7F454_PSEFL|nr:hypothetical protein [Pseudomonas fluorescens]VVO33979.1 hypothetical protein PS833_05225 [Pseudomonas fluorescens]VVQ20494.1 hypothetical protein PS914_06479 [Pseudomonas fluorescens]